jgi:hypothetical protein
VSITAPGTAVSVMLLLRVVSDRSVAYRDSTFMQPVCMLTAL